MDQLELSFLPDLCANDMGAIAEKQARIRYLLTCDSGKAKPDRIAYLVLLGEVIPTWFSADLEACKEALGQLFSFHAREGCERALDPAMCEFCSVFLSTQVGVYFDTFPEDFEWSVFGKDGELVRQGIYAYDYDKHHVKMYTDFNNDVFNLTAGGHGALLALRFGDMNTWHYTMEKVVRNMKRILAEPNQVPGVLSQMVCAGCQWPYFLGRGHEMATMMSDMELDWCTVEAKCDALTNDVERNVFFAPRGNANSGPFLLNMDLVCWMAKLNYVISAPDGAVPRDDVLRALASLIPELLSEYCLKSKDLGKDDSFVLQSLGLSPHLLAALVAEKYGQLDQALAFVGVIHDVDPVRGGDHKPSLHILGNCVKGRVQQQLGQTAEAAAAFEAAVAQGEKVGMPLLVAFALRDLKLFILDRTGHGEHGSKRLLGAVLRGLKDPAEMFTPLLGGLDAAELVALPPPDATYTVTFPARLADPRYTTATTGTGGKNTLEELQTLRLKGVLERAKLAGIGEDELELAMDSEDPKGSVIALILVMAAPAPAPTPVAVLAPSAPRSFVLMVTASDLVPDARMARVTASSVPDLTAAIALACKIPAEALASAVVTTGPGRAVLESLEALPTKEKVQIWSSARAAAEAV